MTAEPNDDLSQLVGAAVQVSNAGKLDQYLRWNLLNLLDELYEDDFTTEELMAINALLAQALSRKLTLTQPRVMLLNPVVVVGRSAEVGGERSLRLLPSAN